MRSRLSIILPIAVVVVALVALNAVSYVRVERTRDSEFDPDRSTYNAGATGTRALYDFLSETNRQVMRWREEPAALLKREAGAARPTTFVVIGQTAQPFESTEAQDLLRWVERGGRLVIIDRSPDARLLPPSGNWLVSTQMLQYPSTNPDSSDPNAMTEGVQPARAVQPTVLTQEVEKVQPSRFASIIKIAAAAKPEPEPTAAPGNPVGVGPATESSADEGDEDERGQAPPPPGIEITQPANANAGSPAPVVHLSDHRGALVVDYPHGTGRIIILSDPFVVANKGLGRADNLRLAVNLLAGSGGGLIAFDEFHQGRRAAQNELFAYFAGTPVLAMLAQLGLIALAVLWTRGRRFARPLPVPQVDRRSSLEFVASMAELQQRARAFDLAIENIYARIRRVLARYAGVEASSPRALIAERVAARSAKLDRQELEALMFECEEAINGAPIGSKKSLALIARLRGVERTLGLRMRARDLRQAKDR